MIDIIQRENGRHKILKQTVRLENCWKQNKGMIFLSKPSNRNLFLHLDRDNSCFCV